MFIYLSIYASYMLYIYMYVCSFIYDLSICLLCIHAYLSIWRNVYLYLSVIPPSLRDNCGMYGCDIRMVFESMGGSLYQFCLDDNSVLGFYHNAGISSPVNETPEGIYTHTHTHTHSHN